MGISSAGYADGMLAGRVYYRKFKQRKWPEFGGESY